MSFLTVKNALTGVARTPIGAAALIATSASVSAAVAIAVAVRLATLTLSARTEEGVTESPVIGIPRMIA